jgi:hypothetical protein
MELLEVETYNLNGVRRKTIWTKMLIDIELQQVLVYCKDVTYLVNGETTTEYLKPFVADNSTLIAVFQRVGQSFEPVWVEYPQPDKYNIVTQQFESQPPVMGVETIGEYDSLVELFFKDRNDVRLKEALTEVIMRRKNLDTGRPYIFVRL